ncbi:MAG: TIGR01459 family HAD-type hydrolase [Pseudomonadota bacterium]
MTQEISRIAEIADRYDVIVFDQWGVLHDGSSPYPGAIRCIESLAARDIAVLSNSGKRARPNAARISAMGFGENAFSTVMTSGEALWADIAACRIAETRFFPIERAAGDAESWAGDLEIELTPLDGAEAVLLMGLPDGATLEDWMPVLHAALERGLPVHCSNPDRKSPRAGGTVISPGALAFAYEAMGGQTSFYGKPHRPVFDALALALPGASYLMVGDSLEHDIAGASDAGWDSVFVSGGLYAPLFKAAPWEAVLPKLAAEQGAPPPTYIIGEIA